MSDQEGTLGAGAATPDQPAPVSATAGQRIDSLDFIRGLAVMGILLANIVAFGQPFSAYFWPEAFLVPAGDPGSWLWVAQFVLVDSKMRGLFSLLFGAGMVLFVEKAWERGATRGLQLRRLGWLLVFGLLHFFLLWRGDILALYAICGSMALLLVTLKPREMIVIASVIYVAMSIVWTAMFGMMKVVAETSLGNRPDLVEAKGEILTVKTQSLADDAVEIPLFQDGSWFDVVGHRLSEHTFDSFAGVIFVAWETVPLMLMGMALYRLGMFDGRMDAKKQRFWGWIGVIVGTALTLAIALWTRADGLTFYGTQFSFLGASMLPRLPVILGLAALLALYGPRATGWLGDRVRAAGRMAFSNYLGTSFLMLFVFSGWALDLFGKLDRPQLYLVVLATWLIMLAWSKPWLDRFRYGPLEWVWRCLTYWRLFPLRR